MKITRRTLLMHVGMFASLGFCAAEPQEEWTLTRCIDYAIEHNITLKKTRLQAESSAVDVKTAKAQLFPSLSANIGERIVNRPFSETNTLINGDNITTSQSKTSYNGSYGVDANWTLWNGGKRVNSINRQKLSHEADVLGISESENTLKENITQLYMQILYAAEAVRTNEATLSVSEATLKRAQSLFEVGSLAKADVAQLESQVAGDRYSVVTAQQQLADYKIQLKQLLEIGGEEELNVYLPPFGDADLLLPLPSKSSVYQCALATRPEIESGKLQVSAADLDIKIARAGYLPTVSLSAGIGSSNIGGSNFTFSEQLKNNWNNSLGLSVNIPIFSNRQTKSAVEKAKIQRETSQLDLAEKQKTLYKTIETLWQDANSAQQRYVAATEKLRSAETSYELTREKFNSGMINTIELLTEKNNLLSAQQEQLQAKYMTILNRKLLDYYNQ